MIQKFDIIFSSSSWFLIFIMKENSSIQFFRILINIFFNKDNLSDSDKLNVTLLGKKTRYQEREEDDNGVRKSED